MYQWPKRIVRWVCGSTLYLSVPFSWLVEEANEMASSWNGPVLIGGPGLMYPTECPGFDPITFHNPAATFTTRGCPNNCPWCAVPRLEGDLVEIKDFRPAPNVCDNNLLAASMQHLERVVDRLSVYPFVDFSQGLDARRFTPERADLLGKLKCKVRFAFDVPKMEGYVADAISLCRSRTTKDIGVYVLVGFRDSPDDALYRLEKVRSWGIRPNPARFNPLGAVTKNTYVGPGWTDEQLLKIMKYYSRLRWLEHIPFEEFDYKDNRQLNLFEGGLNGKTPDRREQEEDL